MGSFAHSKTKKRQTLISVTLKNLVICLLVIVVGTLLIFLAGSKIEENFWDRTDLSYLLSQKETLRAEQYDQLIVGGGFKFSGYFEITDPQAHVIYCSNSKRHNTYTTQSLSFIPDSKAGETFYMEKMKEKSGARFLITRYLTVENESQIAGIILIGAQGKIHYDTVGINADRLNPRTMSILKKNTDRTFLQKQSFRTNHGEVRYLLYHVGNRNKLYHALTDKVDSISIVACIALAAFNLLFFCYRMVQSVRTPLETFTQKIQEFGRTRRVNVKEEEENTPVEFQRILTSFGTLEQQLVKSEQERHAMEGQRRRILTNISHDLKTPATVIQGYAEILANHRASSEEQDKYLNIILKRSNHLVELIHAFFEYNKLNVPDMKPVLKTDDFCEFFREYIADRYEELHDHGNTITVEIPEDVIFLSYDPVLIKRMIENIINNSMRHNQGRADLYTALFQSEQDILIQIGDNGKGIPPALRQSLFSPFVVWNQSRTNGEGTGLGLAIARRIAELHHGTIRLLPEGTKGWNVLFEICLPKVPEE